MQERLNRVTEAPISEVQKGIAFLEDCLNQVKDYGNYLEEICSILKSVAPTICGVKSGELLTYPAKLKNWHAASDVIYSLLKANSGLGSLQVEKQGGAKQILTYHKDALEMTLVNQETVEFLVQIGYPHKFTLTSYLKNLELRMKGQSFPHEIGIFIGYPLGDVKGFMGINPKEVAFIRGWQVYSTREADELWGRISEVRAMAAELMSGI